MGEALLNSMRIIALCQYMSWCQRMECHSRMCWIRAKVCRRTDEETLLRSLRARRLNDKWVELDLLLSWLRFLRCITQKQDKRIVMPRGLQQFHEPKRIEHIGMQIFRMNCYWWSYTNQRWVSTMRQEILSNSKSRWVCRAFDKSSRDSSILSYCRSTHQFWYEVIRDKSSCIQK